MATNLLLQPSLEGNLSAPEASEYLPITSIISNDDIGHTEITKEKLIFCYRVVQRTIEAYQKGEFSKFDPLTTTNCCHGMSLLVRHLLINNSKFDLCNILKQNENKICFLIECCNNNDAISYFNKFFLPHPLISLSQIYILSQIKEEDLIRGGWRSDFSKLKEISPIGTKLCKRLSKCLQTYFSNQVVANYHKYLEKLDEDLLVNGVPLKKWGKYIQPAYIRKDKRGRKYASCLFSMQTSLAYLIQNKAIVAVINDLRCNRGTHKSRFIQLFIGDGHSNFIPIENTNLSHNRTVQYEPVIIFSGCVHSNSMNHEALSFHMSPWLDCFSNLVLACDVFYPQYPNVGDDPNFDSRPIIPDDEDVKSAVESHRRVAGVSVQDPSLFCLSHIYTASLYQILNEMQKRDGNLLPHAFIPSQNKSE